MERHNDDDPVKGHEVIQKLISSLRHLLFLLRERLLRNLFSPDSEKFIHCRPGDPFPSEITDLQRIIGILLFKKSNEMIHKLDRVVRVVFIIWLGIDNKGVHIRFSFFRDANIYYQKILL